MKDCLVSLAGKLGIATKFVDAGLVRQEYDVDENIIKYFVSSLGFKAATEEEVNNSLADLEAKRWQRALENIYVVEQKAAKFDVVIPAAVQDGDFSLDLRYSNCEQKFDVSFEVVNTGEQRNIGKTPYVRLEVNITSDLEVGYYDLYFKAAGKEYKSVLAVAPERCYENPALEEKKLWGYAIQLYAVKSDRNWGGGDFTDLCNLVRICKDSGADIIGLNPLNVLFHNYPENASPYSSISRLFLNPIYIDVEAVPEFMPEDKQKVDSELYELRNSELIRYSQVYPLKMSVLEHLYDRFVEGKDSKRQTEYKKFCEDKGRELDELALFQTLYEQKAPDHWGGWRAWEDEYRNRKPMALQAYAKEHEYRIGFFKYLQFEADRQFAAANQLVKELGLKIGFYRDLAVGVGLDSAEVWSENDMFIKNVGAGAPPDFLNPKGQKWCLGAFNPYALKENGYLPFIKILRANMEYAGALRIDHVMSLMRLYLIPNNQELGTYLYYNFNDMLNIVAIESHLNKCVVVGESIGNVPEGFLEALFRKNIHPLSVLWAERKDAGWGDFNSPSEYLSDAFTSVGTHDMAPLRMWWFGYDISQMRSLGIIDNDAAKEQAYHQRELDRWKLLFALDSNNVWPQDNLRKNNYIYGEGYPEGIEEAVHRFVARSRSLVFLAQLEDILHVEKMQNLPGTDYDRHPNWRRKLPVALEHLESDPAFIRNIAAIHKER